MDQSLKEYWVEKCDNLCAFLQEGEDYLPKLQKKADAVQHSRTLKQLAGEIYESSRQNIDELKKILELFGTYVDLVMCSFEKYDTYVEHFKNQAEQQQRVFEEGDCDDLFKGIANFAKAMHYKAEQQRTCYRNVSELSTIMMISTIQLAAANTVCVITQNKSEFWKRIVCQGKAIFLGAIGFGELGLVFDVIDLGKNLIGLADEIEVIGTGYNKEMSQIDQMLANMEKQAEWLNKLKEDLENIQQAVLNTTEMERQSLQHQETSLQELRAISRPDYDAERLIAQMMESMQ